MATYNTTIVWHDLIEDPTDLPKENGLYWALVKNRYSNEVCEFSYTSPECIYHYIKECRIWKQNLDDGYGECTGDIAYESIGTKRNLDIDLSKDRYRFNLVHEHYSDEILIIAWAGEPNELPDSMAFKRLRDHIKEINKDVH